MEGEIHPKAYLANKRNVKAGLSSRTKILLSLEKGGKRTNELCGETGLSYAQVLHHLKLMRRERIVEPKTDEKPYVWTLTKYGQQRLT